MTEFDVDRKLLDKLIKAFKDADLTDLELENGETKIKLRRRVTNQVVAGAAPQPVVTVAPSAAATSDAAPAVASGAEAADAKSDENALTSPMVGTVYLSPEPGKPAFVKEGSKVDVGDVLMIIEAMKVMNNFQATQAGTVTKIMVSDGSPVEFGQPLIVIE